jgi:hypothetical protein
MGGREGWRVFDIIIESSFMGFGFEGGGDADCGWRARRKD